MYRDPEHFKYGTLQERHFQYKTYFLHLQTFTFTIPLWDFNCVLHPTPNAPNALSTQRRNLCNKVVFALVLTFTYVLTIIYVICTVWHEFFSMKEKTFSYKLIVYFQYIFQTRILLTLCYGSKWYKKVNTGFCQSTSEIFFMVIMSRTNHSTGLTFNILSHRHHL